MTGTKAFQAYAAQGSVTAATPREAAQQFFTKYPNRRKCDVVEGTHDGQCFTRVVGLRAGNRTVAFYDVTKKTAADLPSA